MSNNSKNLFFSEYNKCNYAFLEECIKVKEPIPIFQDWYNAALPTEKILEPNAAGVCIASAFNKPSSQLVLVREFSKEGFTFCTNYGSQTAQEIAGNPRVALNFNWAPLHRSVLIEGCAEKTSEEKWLKYFHGHPRASQIGILASNQISTITSRSFLDEKEAKIKDLLGSDQDVPIPIWGGFLVRPHLIEFWQGQTNRLHDRICFRKSTDPEEVDGLLVQQGEDGWVYERLDP